MFSKESNKIIQKYTNPSLPGSFSGLSGFIKNNKEYKNSRIVKKVLRSLPTYTLHNKIKHTFPRRKTLVNGIDDQWQVDLVDLTKEAGSNYKYKFILTCIDVFSKYAWAVPMLNKSSISTTKAFETIFIDGRIPKTIYSDDGKEFKGECKKLLESKGIQIFITNAKVKAAVIERFNRTLKEKIYRFFTFNKSVDKSTNLSNKRYIDILPNILKSYNNSFHRSINMKPVEVSKSNENQVYINLYGYNKNEGDDTFVKVKFKPGTYVRLVKSKNIFEKGYIANWTKDIYIVDKIFAQVPLLYQVKKLNSDFSEGTFYAEELQKIELPFDTFEVIDQIDKNTLKVVQLNKENPEVQQVDKSSFLGNQYSLRSSKK